MDEQDLAGEKYLIKLYAPEEGLLGCQTSTLGLVSRHGSMASRSGLIDPLVTLFGSVHEKLPDTGSFFHTLAACSAWEEINPDVKLEWDEESLAREGEDYVSDAAAGDSDDNLQSPLISRQTTSMDKDLGVPPHAMAVFQACSIAVLPETAGEAV